MELTLGRNIANQPVIWKSIDNSNILTLGRSGQGKSVQQSLIASQLVQQGFHVVFLDSANEYGKCSAGKPTSWPPSSARLLDITSPMVPIQTLFPNLQDDGTWEPLELAASRIAQTFQHTMRLGPVQTAYLSQIILAHFDSQHRCSISALVSQIQEDAFARDPQAKRLGFRFSNFCIFPEVSPEWSIPISQPGVTIINISSIMECADQKCILEILMCNLWFHKKSSPHAAPLVIMLDECQNISFQEGLRARKIIKEGRKYGISGCFSTQSLDGKDMAVLGEAGLKLFFLPGDMAEKYTIAQLESKMQGNRNEIQRDLRGLMPGTFLYRTHEGSVIWVDARTEIQSKET